MEQKLNEEKIVTKLIRTKNPHFIRGKYLPTLQTNENTKAASIQVTKSATCPSEGTGRPSIGK